MHKALNKCKKSLIKVFYWGNIWYFALIIRSLERKSLDIPHIQL
jgi:hypothetical protein